MSDFLKFYIHRSIWNNFSQQSSKLYNNYKANGVQTTTLAQKKSTQITAFEDLAQKPWKSITQAQNLPSKMETLPNKYTTKNTITQTQGKILAKSISAQNIWL